MIPTCEKMTGGILVSYKCILNIVQGPVVGTRANKYVRQFLLSSSSHLVVMTQGKQAVPTG